MLSAGLAAVVAAAATTMVWSVSRESMLLQSEQTAALRGHAVLRRLATALHACRTVSIDGATQMTIWHVDDYPAAGSGGTPGDDQPQVSEIETIAYDAPNRRIVRTYVDFAGASAATIATLNTNVNIPGLASVNLNTILASNPGLAPYTRTEIWAEDVNGCTFRGVNKGGLPVMVAINLTVGAGTSAQSLHRTVNLAGPAYYLGGSNKTSDGMSGGRIRPTAAWTW